VERIDVRAVVGVDVAEDERVDLREIGQPLKLGERAVAGVDPHLRRAVLEEKTAAGVAGGRVAAGAA
jgi:hypothetical protein